MSEKIYAWLLRLYPSRFREAYGDDALQLFRDRARDEKGFFASLRLWLDLLVDLAGSLPREHLLMRSALSGASTQPCRDGTPSFQVLEGKGPHPGALLFGCVVSMTVLAVLPILISHVESSRPSATSTTQPQRPAEERSSSGHQVPQAASGTKEEVNGGAKNAGEDATAQGQPVNAAGTKPSDARKNGFRSNSLLPAPGSPRQQAPQQQGAAGSIVQAAKPEAAERRRVIDGAVSNLRKYYIDPDVAQKTADALLAHEKNGDDDAVMEGGAFADLLNRQMKDVSHDPYLLVAYYKTGVPEDPPDPTPEERARYKKKMVRNHCTFEKVTILPHNIGYLKLNAFPDLEACRPTAAAVMSSLNQTDAVIFDLRDNHGGNPKMVALFCGYLFDHPTHLNDFYDRGENSTEHLWTLTPAPGNKLADKPAYVLISSGSFSAAEVFSYDLKMLKRAVIVGETSSGRRHIGMPHRIDDHFLIRVPGIKVINPVSRTNWEGTGVEPDIKVKAADALETAEKLAASRLRKK